MNNQKNNSKNDLFIYLYFISSIISVVLFFLSVYIRRTNNSSYGIVLPISGIIIGICFLVTNFLFIACRNTNQTNKCLFIKQKIINNSLILSALGVWLIEICLVIIGIIVFLNSSLFGKAYFGIVPALFQVLSFSIITILFLNKCSSIFRSLFLSVFRYSYREYFLFSILLIECFFLGKLISQKAIQRLSDLLGRFTDSAFLIWICTAVIGFLLLDLILFFIYLLPSDKKIFAKSLDQKKPFWPRLVINPLVLSFVILGLFIVFNLFILHPGYETNDDIVMIELLSGYLGGIPVEFSINSNVLLGLVFQQLFFIFPSINWISVCYILIIITSTWLLVYLFLISKKLAFQKAFGILTTLLFCSYYFVNLTYTTTAALACIAGTCSFLVNLCHKKKPLNFQVILGLFLLIIGSLIRLETLLMVLIIFSSPVLLNIRRYINKKSLTVLIITLSIIGISFCVNKTYVSNNPSWDDFYNYIDLNHKLRDTPRYRNLAYHQDILPSIGWSLGDIQLFNHWLSLDKSVYSEEVMTKLIKTIPNWNYDLKQTIESYKEIISLHPTREFLFFSVACFIFLLLGKKNKKNTFTALLMAVFVIVIGFILTYGYKFPPRISTPLIMSFATGIFFLPSEFDPSGKAQNNKLHFSKFQEVGALLILILSFQGRQLLSYSFNISKIYQTQQEVYLSYVQGIDSQLLEGTFTEESLILAPNAGFPFYFMDPLSLNFPKVKILTGGWNSFSPSYVKELENNGVSIHPQKYVDQPEFYLLTLKKLIPNIETFYKEHYGLKIHCVIVSTINSNLLIEENIEPIVIYKLVSESE